MVRVKDEDRFLPEWVAYHSILGIEHFYVYDNNSLNPAAAVLRPFVEAGLVTCIEWPNVPASPSCHLDFLRRFGRESGWVAFLDADEFIVEEYAGAFLSLITNTMAPAIGLNWRYFGSSGHVTIPDGLLLAGFERCDRSLDDHVKVVARPSEIAAYRNPHSFYYKRARLARGADGRRIWGSFLKPRGAVPVSIHHYVYRSMEDYERKAKRGFADARGQLDQARRSSLASAEFGRHNAWHLRLDREKLVSTASLLRALGYPEHLFQRGTQ